MMKKVFVFSGPSGAGKSTLIKFLLKTFSNIGTTVSCTTREKRAGEIECVDYHFIPRKKFLGLVIEDEFIEHVECYGNLYGTMKSSIDNVLMNKDACILDMNYEGAYKILSGNFPSFEAIGILVLPPSIASLENRLMNRNSENSESLIKRLSESFEADKIGRYQHVIVNKNLDESKESIKKIFESHFKIN